MTEAIVFLWIVTLFVMLLGACLPGGLPALFSPDSRMARDAGSAACLGMGVASVVYLLRRSTILGTPIHVLASVALAAYIWAGVLHRVALTRRGA